MNHVTRFNDEPKMPIQIGYVSNRDGWWLGVWGHPKRRSLGNFGDENPMCDRCLPNNDDFNGDRDSDDFSINVTHHLINIYCLRVYINILAVIISERNSNLQKDTWWHCCWGFRLNTPRSQSGIGFCHTDMWHAINYEHDTTHFYQKLRGTALNPRNKARRNVEPVLNRIATSF